MQYVFNFLMNFHADFHINWINVWILKVLNNLFSPILSFQDLLPVFLMLDILARERYNSFNFRLEEGVGCLFFLFLRKALT